MNRREGEREVPHHLLRGLLLVLSQLSESGFFAFLNIGPRSLRRKEEWMEILGFVEVSF